MKYYRLQDSEIHVDSNGWFHFRTHDGRMIGPYGFYAECLRAYYEYYRKHYGIPHWEEHNV